MKKSSFSSKLRNLKDYYLIINKIPEKDHKEFPEKFKKYKYNYTIYLPSKFSYLFGIFFHKLNKKFDYEYVGGGSMIYGRNPTSDEQIWIKEKDVSEIKKFTKDFFEDFIKNSFKRKL